jgi:cytochrome c oxidase subunit 4
MHGHVVSARALLSTFAALIVLTVVTVAVSRLQLGQMNVVVALGVACTKAALVAAFFMHLKYEGRANLVLLLTSVFFLIVLLVFVIYDSRAYHGDVERWDREHPREAATAAD